jgi:hypothetical protein
MAITPITYSSFSGKKFSRDSSMRFAARDTLVPLALNEIPRAAMTMPIAFVKTETGFTPTAVLALGSTVNLFVTVDGQWEGGYLPATYRGYPFKLAKVEQNHILCIDDQSGCINTVKGEHFFLAPGKPSKFMQDVLSFLTQLELARIATQEVCGLLDTFGLIVPWATADGKESKLDTDNLNGLFRVSEEALNGLDQKSLFALHSKGVLPLIYGHLLSLQNLALLSERALSREKVLTRQDGLIPDNLDKPELDFYNLDINFETDLPH